MKAPFPFPPPPPLEDAGPHPYYPIWRECFLAWDAAIVERDKARRFAALSWACLVVASLVRLAVWP